MKFCWCTISVKNLDESLKFYQDIVGLTLDRRFAAGPGSEIASLGKGETQLELMYHGPGRGGNFGSDISLGFEVDSLDKKMAFVKEKGIDIQGGPFQPNPHVRFFYVQDPDGLKIQFVENL